jgi:hypothetical protein
MEGRGKKATALSGSIPRWCDLARHLRFAQRNLEHPTFNRETPK